MLPTLALLLSVALPAGPAPPRELTGTVVRFSCEQDPVTGAPVGTYGLRVRAGGREVTYQVVVWGGGWEAQEHHRRVLAWLAAREGRRVTVRVAGFERAGECVQVLITDVVREPDEKGERHGP